MLEIDIAENCGGSVFRQGHNYGSSYSDDVGKSICHGFFFTIGAFNRASPY